MGLQVKVLLQKHLRPEETKNKRFTCLLCVQMTSFTCAQTAKHGTRQRCKDLKGQFSLSEVGMYEVLTTYTCSEEAKQCVDIVNSKMYVCMYISV